MRRRSKMLDRHFKDVMVLSDTPSEFLKEIDERLICIDITNAAQWFFEESEQDIWHLENDFPCAVSPWPFAWYEFSCRGITERISGDGLSKLADSIGCHVITMELNTERDDVLGADPAMMMIKSYGRKIEVENSIRRRERMVELSERGVKPRWMGIVRAFFERRKRLIPAMMAVLYYDENGRALTESLLVFPLMYTKGVLDTLDDEDVEQLKDGCVMLLWPFAFAISLAHCKNTSLVDLPPLPKKRKRRKSDSYGRVTYKTLIINSLRKQVRSSSDSDGGEQIKQALHIVRGHFKDFRDGPGLFGKFKDVYWWDMHTRGDVKHGRVEKDYKVLGKSKK